MPVSSGTHSSTFSANYSDLYGFANYKSIGEAMSGSFLTIKAGEAKITIFGSMIENQKERMFELNQNLTSDAVHEALHFDNPIVDQYHLDDKSAYSGSYIGEMVYGFINHDDGLPDLPKKNPFLITRGVKGSLVSSNPLTPGKVYTTDSDGVSSIGRDSQGLANHNRYLFGETNISANRGSFLTAVKVIDKHERIFDTIMPDMKDYARRSGMTVIPHGTLSIIQGTINGKFNEETISSANGVALATPVSNKKAFPYVTDKPRKKLDQNILFFDALSADPLSGGTQLKSYGLKASLGDSKFQPVVANAILFKNGTNIKLKTTTSTVSGDVFITICPPYTTASNSRPYSIPYGANSFMYGIENIRATYTSAYFRHDRYGQFRDLLEQRRDGKFLFTSQASDSFRKPSSPQDGPVQCVFVKSEDGLTITSPYNTDCSNMSTEATSSMPYFDDESRNKANKLPGSGIVRIVGATTVAPSFYTATPVTLP